MASCGKRSGVGPVRVGRVPELVSSGEEGHVEGQPACEGARLEGSEGTKLAARTRAGPSGLHRRAGPSLSGRPEGSGKWAEVGPTLAHQLRSGSASDSYHRGEAAKSRSRILSLLHGECSCSPEGRLSASEAAVAWLRGRGMSTLALCKYLLSPYHTRPCAGQGDSTEQEDMVCAHKGPVRAPSKATCPLSIEPLGRPSCGHPRQVANK
ncbi:uncharacterized protein LOC122221366 [Panthera leo]|uniref:uncharacterized protein LOC122221366 n=1 Tax=Panthera leo TaxID=9689 RepID=UPI001C6A3E39|nr:uncharacterized protein LOC122221366 [Panthera leo]